VGPNPYPGDETEPDPSRRRPSSSWPGQEPHWPPTRSPFPAAPAHFGQTPGVPGPADYQRPPESLKPWETPDESAALRPETQAWTATGEHPFPGAQYPPPDRTFRSSAPGHSPLDHGAPTHGDLNHGDLNHGGPGRDELDGPAASPWWRRGTLAAVAAVAAVIVAAVVVFAANSGGGTGGEAGPGTAAGGFGTSSSPAASPTASSASPAPHQTVTLGQIFPGHRLTVTGTHFTQVSSSTDTNCSQTAQGAFASALTAAGCERVVRATFVDSGRKYAITAGVAVMPSAAAASQVSHSMEFGHDIWFTALDGPSKSGAESIGKTVGVGYNVVHGAFIVYALATYSDGHNPTRQQTQVQELTTLSKSFATLEGQKLGGS